MQPSLSAYTLFHLNLAYSSIDESLHPEVIERCYWPLLDLARNLELPFGIEASGYTLERIKTIDSHWIKELKDLVINGPCEFIGSGYTQIIGPLMPAEINAANLRIGHQFYERILQIKPVTALINEQAYSTGLIEHYLNAGYEAIIMEWDNPARFHPEWPSEWSYLPQLACNQSGRHIPLIWNKSIAFQKFQRYVYAEMTLDDYLEYLTSHMADNRRMLPIYCNDAEIFNFRPGRYTTEPTSPSINEWNRIGRLFENLKSDGRFTLIAPKGVLELISEAEAGHSLSLESAEQPVPVKKQGKYNITRWAVTGQNDLAVNSACWRIYEKLKSLPTLDNSPWQELCYLWSSDFRTHITKNRWESYKTRLAAFEQKTLSEDASAALKNNAWVHSTDHTEKPPDLSGDISIDRQDHILQIQTDAIRIRLNCRKGLAVDRLWFKALSDSWLCGTLPQGYYDNINWSVDFYSGHLIFEAPGQHKITDLDCIEPEICYIDSAEDCTKVSISTKITVPPGPIYKEIMVFKNLARVDISYRLEWPEAGTGSLRLGHITLNPLAFSQNSLVYQTHNGGENLESYFVQGKNITQGDPVSFLVSAQSGLGLTKGEIFLGDSDRRLCVKASMHQAALLGMITYREIGDDYFYRLSFSGGELDETNCNKSLKGSDGYSGHHYRISICPGD